MQTSSTLNGAQRNTPAAPVSRVVSRPPAVDGVAARAPSLSSRRFRRRATEAALLSLCFGGSRVGTLARDITDYRDLRIEVG